MFDGFYYTNKFVNKNKQGTHILCEELYKPIGENLLLCSYIDENNNFITYIIKYKTFLYERGQIKYLKEALLSLGYTNKDFLNPFTRTQKIVKAISNNNINKPKTLTKSKY